MKKTLMLFTAFVSFIVFSFKSNAFTYLCQYELQTHDGGVEKVDVGIYGLNMYVAYQNERNSSLNGIYSFSNTDYSMLRSTNSESEIPKTIIDILLPGFTKVVPTGATELPLTWDNSEQVTEFKEKGICPNYMYLNNDTVKETNPHAFFSQYSCETCMKKITPVKPGANKTYFLNYNYQNRFSRFANCDSNEYSKIYESGRKSTIKADYNDIISLYKVGFSGATSYKEKRKLNRFYTNMGYYSDTETLLKNYTSGGKCTDFAKYNGISDSDIQKLKELYEKFLKDSDYEPQNIDIGVVDVKSCSDIIGNGNFAKYLKTSIKFIQYAAPILLIIFSIIDYMKALAANDDDVLKKVNKKTIIRLAATLLLFIIPALINVILEIFGITNNCNLF